MYTYHNESFQTVQVRRMDWVQKDADTIRFMHKSPLFYQGTLTSCFMLDVQHV